MDFMTTRTELEFTLYKTHKKRPNHGNLNRLLYQIK